MRKHALRLFRFLCLLTLGIGVLFLFYSNGSDNVSLYVLGGSLIVIALLMFGITVLVTGIYRKRGAFLSTLLLSIRTRLMLWYMVLVLPILALSNSLVYNVTRWNMVSELDTNLRAYLVQVAHSYDSHSGDIVLGNGQSSQEIVLLLTSQGAIKQISTNQEQQKQEMSQFVGEITTSVSFRETSSHLATQGQFLGTTSQGARIYALSFTTFRHLADGDYRFDLAGIMVGQQGPVAYVLVGIRTDLFFWLDTLTRIQWITAAVALLLLGASGYWLAGRSLIPVQRITHAAQQISATDLHQRLRLPGRDEIGELAATFDHMLARLEAAFERQRQFTSDASHELRTPLAVVDLEVTHALSSELSPEESRRMLITVQQEVRSMAHLVNDLLTLARTENGVSPVSYGEVDLGGIILDTLERLAPLAQTAGVEVQVAPLPELMIKGDPSSLIQLLVNVIENAIKYTAGTGTRVMVTLVQEEKKRVKWARLSISDDGPGISPEHLPHVFERFYRADRSRTHYTAQGTASDEESDPPKGNGLGLSIALSIAQAHGGTIQVRSQDHHGSTFEIWLPISS